MLHCITCHKVRISGFVGILYMQLFGLFHMNVSKEPFLNFFTAAYLRMHNACCKKYFLKEISGNGKGDLKIRRTQRRVSRLSLEFFSASVKHSKSGNVMQPSIYFPINACNNQK